jgi:hypothetical protein
MGTPLIEDEEMESFLISENASAHPMEFNNMSDILSQSHNTNKSK